MRNRHVGNHCAQQSLPSPLFTGPTNCPTRQPPNRVRGSADHPLTGFGAPSHWERIVSGFRSYQRVVKFLVLAVVYPKRATTTKQTKGKTKEKLTAGSPKTESRSTSIPCSGGIKAPPTIAITNPAAPRVVSSPTPSREMP